jgi:hypothetical protein
MKANVKCQTDSTFEKLTDSVAIESLVVDNHSPQLAAGCHHVSHNTLPGSKRVEQSATA